MVEDEVTAHEPGEQREQRWMADEFAVRGQFELHDRRDAMGVGVEAGGYGAGAQPVVDPEVDLGFEARHEVSGQESGQYEISEPVEPVELIRRRPWGVEECGGHGGRHGGGLRSERVVAVDGAVDSSGPAPWWRARG
ncbi:hypothetical protein [Streptomyces jumonjinensis]|uniref:hypothetical protein n=1 Tax=Streptomyces jumonjinensis TaxID=1945 RepID=UPI0037957C6F